MAPPEPGAYRPLMAPAGAPHRWHWRRAHVELRLLLWLYAAMLALIVVALQSD